MGPAKTLLLRRKDRVERTLVVCCRGVSEEYLKLGLKE
jgi:hypothetical protein